MITKRVIVRYSPHYGAPSTRGHGRQPRLARGYLRCQSSLTMKNCSWWHRHHCGAELEHQWLHLEQLVVHHLKYNQNKILQRDGGLACRNADHIPLNLILTLSLGMSTWTLRKRKGNGTHQWAGPLAITRRIFDIWAPIGLWILRWRNTWTPFIESCHRNTFPCH